MSWPALQSIELFGHTEALNFVTFHLTLAKHRHQLDAGKGGLRCLMAHPEWIANALERAHGGHGLPKELPSHRDALHKAHANLSTQFDRWTEAYLHEVIPLAEYQRRRHNLEQKQQGLEAQKMQLEAQMDRQSEMAGMGTSIEAFCQRVGAGLAEATFEQKRTLVELLIDRVLVANGDVEIRYAIPTALHLMFKGVARRNDNFFHCP